MQQQPRKIDDFPIYQKLSEAGKTLLDEKTQYVKCPAAQTIILQGQKASGAYIVLKGRLRVYSISPKGNEATLYNIDPGETCVLALNCLFNDLLYPAWVDSEPDTEIAVIPGAVYRRLFAYEQDVQDLTVRSLSTLVFRLMDQLGDVHGMTQRERLASFLLSRATPEGEIRMTQQQLADHIGTRREVVARQLLEFSDQATIATGRGVIRLLDAAKLRDIAHHHG